MVTGKQVVEAAKKHLGEPYLYGCKHEVLTLDKYNYLQDTYGSNCVWDSDKSKVGLLCCDCSGLCYIAPKEAGGESHNIGSSQFYSLAKEVKPISDIANAPVGAFLWMKGHIGIYIGDGNYIAEDGSAYGCRIAPLSSNRWTHYLLMDYIEYSTSTSSVAAATVVTITDTDLLNAVSKIIKAGKLDLESLNIWKRTDLITNNLGNVPALIFKLGGLEYINKIITGKGMSFDLAAWQKACAANQYNVNNVRSLLVKYASCL